MFGALKIIGGIATTFLEGKQAAAKAKAQKDLKIATGDIDWELEAMKATQTSYKDEWIVGLLSIPFLLCFISDTTREMAFKGFEALSQAPAWYTYSFGVVVAASFGIRSATKFFGGKK